MLNDREPEYNQVLKAFLASRDALLRSIMKLCARQEDVDDILQETFLRVYAANEKTRITSLQDYLFVVSRNLVMKKLSRQSREIVLEINDAMMDANEISPETQLHYQKMFESFNKALSSLPEKNRRAILLRKFYGLSHREIARKMHVSVSSVEKYISEGIKRCKQNLYLQGYEYETKKQQNACQRRADDSAGIK